MIEGSRSSRRPPSPPDSPPDSLPGSLAGSLLTTFASWTTHLASAATCALVLIAAGQPLFTDDLWMHLALGRAYADKGLDLASDPHLFTAAAPPAPAAWLADLGLYAALDRVGFNGLRVLHVAILIAILALAWVGARRASKSAAVASVSTALFAAISAYRLIQLRPELASIGLLLILYLTVLDPEARRPAWKLLFVAAISAAWVNLHAAFLLAPVLLFGVSGALLAVSLLCAEPTRRGRYRDRGRFLAGAAGFSLLGTLCNPRGLGAHSVFWDAGRETPDLGIAVDEWRAVDLFDLPIESLPPSWLSWLAVWAFAIVVVVAGARLVTELRRTDSGDVRVDPGLFALAVAALIGILISVRFLWLAFFCLLLIGHACRGSFASRRTVAGALAGLALGGVGAFWFLGDWPMVSRAIRPSLAHYARAYPPEKNNGHAVWMLRDAELEGNVYNRYSMGGFMSFWLAPRLQMSASGSMNMGRDRFEEQLALRRRTGAGGDETFAGLLDRAGIDLFLGSGLPMLPRPGQTHTTTTGHLENTPGWLLIFRNLDSALYLRDNPRNRPNLERVAAYYRRRGVPFDPAVGLDLRRVIAASPQWALEQGIVPKDFGRLLAAERAIRLGAVPDRESGPAIERLAQIYAALGLYEEMLATNRIIRSAAPTFRPAIRRELFALLRLGRIDEASDLATEFVATAPPDSFLHQIAQSAIDAREMAEEERQTLSALLPILTPTEGRRLTSGYVLPESREP